jgi:hypothetical protein
MSFVTAMSPVTETVDQAEHDMAEVAHALKGLRFEATLAFVWDSNAATRQ